MAGKHRKIPKPHLQPPAVPKRVPKPREFQPSGGTGCLRVRFNSIDVGGPWCLSTIATDHFADLLNRLKSFESMRCADVFAPGSEMGKTYAVDHLPNTDAANRLVELQLDDQTEIARLRISGERRLYGFLPNSGPDFYALWWDPNHEIWPSVLKHT
jgi:hypothetical protein